MQSYYETVGNLARIFGPVICTATYMAVNTRTFLSMGILGGLTTLVVLFVVLRFTHIRKIEPESMGSAPEAAVAAPKPKKLGCAKRIALSLLCIVTNFSFGLPLPSLKAFVETSQHVT